MSDQDYIPGTNVIKNLIGRDEQHPFGTENAARLQMEEEQATAMRMLELRRAPQESPQRAFTFGYMRQIHHHLFQDVYAWAGEPRYVPMSKLGVKYAQPNEMNQLLRGQFKALGEQNYLRGIDTHDEFTRRLATFWGEINHGHAFREGNTRSQAVFFTQLAQDAGWQIDIDRLAPNHPQSLYRRFVDARFEHQRLRQTPGVAPKDASLGLAHVLSQIITPVPSTEHTAQPKQMPDWIAKAQHKRVEQLARSEGVPLTTNGFIDFTGETAPPRPKRTRQTEALDSPTGDDYQL